MSCVCICGDEALLRCTACSGRGLTGVYCTQEHQKVFWSYHKLFCKHDKTLKEGAPNIILQYPLVEEEFEYLTDMELVYGNVGDANANHETLNLSLSKLPLASRNHEYAQFRANIIETIAQEEFNLIAAGKPHPFYYIAALQVLCQRNEKSLLIPFIAEFFLLVLLLNVPASKARWKSIKASILRLEAMHKRLEETSHQRPSTATRGSRDYSVADGDEWDRRPHKLGVMRRAVDVAHSLENAYGQALRLAMTEEEYSRRKWLAVRALGRG